MIRSGRLWAATGLALLALSFGAQAAEAPKVVVRQSRFELVGDDGAARPQSELVGLVLTVADRLGGARRLRIDSAEPDPTDPSGEVVLYGLSEQVDGAWRNICQPDAQGRTLAFPIPGRFTETMQHVETEGTISFSCTGGAEAKCIRFGYKPWGHTPDGASLAPYYQSCLRLVRADYCGDGVGHTRNGTPIDIFDRIGIQKDETAPGMSFEAAFAPDGAVCVAHPRLMESPTLAELGELCPKLASKVGAGCDETAAGLVFVRSFPDRP